MEKKIQAWAQGRETRTCSTCERRRCVREKKACLFCSASIRGLERSKSVKSRCSGVGACGCTLLTPTGVVALGARSLSCKCRSDGTPLTKMQLCRETVGRKKYKQRTTQRPPRRTAYRTATHRPQEIRASRGENPRPSNANVRLKGKQALGSNTEPHQHNLTACSHVGHVSVRQAATVATVH